MVFPFKVYFKARTLKVFPSISRLISTKQHVFVYTLYYRSLDYAKSSPSYHPKRQKAILSVEWSLCFRSWLVFLPSNCSSESYPRAGCIDNRRPVSLYSRTPAPLRVQVPDLPRLLRLSSGLPLSFVSRFFLAFLPVRGAPSTSPVPPLPLLFCLYPRSSRRSLGRGRLSFSSAYAHLKCVYTPSLASSFVKRARVVVLARSVKI